MAKRKYSVDKRTIEKRLKQGRGSGFGREYIPWIFVHEVPSKGKSSIRKGWKTGRDHHLLSTLETKYFFMLEWASEVKDIREQFPLLPLSETIEIANELNIVHPIDPKSKDFIVMTTDFVPTVTSSYQDHIVARAVKYEDDLRDPRTAEKLKIEKAYWKRRKVDWAIITETSIDPVLVANTEWIRKSLDLRGYLDCLNESIYELACEELTIQINQRRNMPLRQITNYIDRLFCLRDGVAMALLQHLIAIRKIPVDMSVKIDPFKPIKLLDKGCVR